MARSTRRQRRLRTLRGGGTASWGFAAPPQSSTINNPMAWAPNTCGGPSTYYQPPHMGGGLPGLSTGAGVSLQKGGGGGTHYGFSPNGGLFGGVTSIPTNCASPPQSGGSGQLNVSPYISPLGNMNGGRRNRKQRQSRNNRNRSKNISRKNRNSRRR